MKSNKNTHQPELTSVTLWIMTITTCLVVANIYYNQPLLGDIAHTYHVNSAKAGQVSMLTQVGYALGLLFIVPLGDMFERKRLMQIDFVFVIISLLAAAWAPTIGILMIASLLVGVTSVIPQLLIPMAAHLAKPHERGRKIGFIMSGLLIGILGSRFIAGYVGHWLGWRAMFYIAAGINLIIWALVYFQLPKVHPDNQVRYRELMRSIFSLIKQEPKLRIASIRGALCFACFSAFWSTLIFLLKQPQFNLGSEAAGNFGLIGAAGAITVGLVGKITDKVDPYKLSIFTIILIIISFGVFLVSSYSLIGLAIGVILMDVGVQATHISNQSIIFGLQPSARNRINTVYMVSYFIGGSLGTLLASLAWDNYQWTGVCIIGMLMPAVALIMHLANRKTLQTVQPDPHS
jgi:predicted MFS family arabinose efflux permease